MRSTRDTLITLTVVGATAVLTASCATTTQSGADLLAESAITEAEAAGAQQYAPLELRKAKRKMEQAETAREKRDYDVANRLEEQARLDAELAELKARSSKTQKAIDELDESMRVLRQELERMGSG